MKTLSNRAYEATILDELPSGSALNYFPPAHGGQGGHDGVIVGIKPAHQSRWVGTFAFGAGTLTGLFACPDSGNLCVISRGDGYLINAANPADWTKLPVDPINRVFNEPESNMLILNDFTDVYAWGRSGLLWKTDRLASDDVEIKQIDEQAVTGIATKFGRPVRFVVDIRTGKILSIEPSNA